MEATCEFQPVATDFLSLCSFSVVRIRQIIDAAGALRTWAVHTVHLTQSLHDSMGIARYVKSFFLCCLLFFACCERMHNIWAAVVISDWWQSTGLAALEVHRLIFVGAAAWRGLGQQVGK